LQLYGNPSLRDKSSRLQVGKHYNIKVYLLNLFWRRSDGTLNVKTKNKGIMHKMLNNKQLTNNYDIISGSQGKQQSLCVIIKSTKA